MSTKPDKTIALMFCVNHWRNGVFTGLCSGIALGTSLNLESPYCDRHLRFRVDTSQQITLGLSHKYPYFSYREWVGNWCWDQATFTVNAATDLLNFALQKGYRWDSIDEELLELLEVRRGEGMAGWLPQDLRRYAK